MSDAVIIPTNHIERKPNSEHYRIVGKGVTVEFLSRLIDDPQWTVERICTNYGLTPAEVHAAWAFYYDHQAEIDQRVDADAAQQRVAAQSDGARRERVQQRYQVKTGRAYPPSDD
ncbi:MAG: DUF433 domain-containing protein [Chloroflexota bacterium]